MDDKEDDALIEQAARDYHAAFGLDALEHLRVMEEVARSLGDDPSAETWADIAQLVAKMRARVAC